MSLNKKFPHAVNDVIIVKCENNYYYGKIKSIDKRRRKCKVLFDDKSTDDLSFNDIYSGKFCILTASLFRICRRSIRYFAEDE